MSVDDFDVVAYIDKVEADVYATIGITPFELWATTPSELESMLEGGRRRREVELNEWDVRFANLSHLLWAVNYSGKGKKYKPKDFMPKRQAHNANERKSTTMDDEQMMNVANALNVAMGGDVR